MINPYLCIKRIRTININTNNCYYYEQLLQKQSMREISLLYICILRHTSFGIILDQIIDIL